MKTNLNSIISNLPAIFPSSPQYGQSKGQVAPCFAWFRPLEESCQESADEVPDLEEEEASNRDVELAGPDGGRRQGGDNLSNSEDID